MSSAIGDDEVIQYKILQVGKFVKVLNPAAVLKLTRFT